MKKAKIFLLFILFLLLMPGITLAENLCPQNACGNSPCQDPLRTKECLDYTNCLQDATNKCGKQRVDLTSQINYMDTQIKLTTSKIYQTQNQILILDDQIASLSGQIGRLESSLGDLSKILLGRIAETYKKGNPSPFSLLLSANGFSDLLSRLKYLRLAQAHDKKLMFSMQQTKDNYTDQKQAREDKKKQLDGLKITLARQKNDLDSQQQAKKNLLTVTQNDEQHYQSLLASALAEQTAVENALVAGVKMGPVKAGDIIGLVGNSGYPGCSTGKHLHFEIRKDGNWTDPFPYLQNKTVVNEQDGTGNVTIGSGSWSWPIADNIEITQFYGRTPYSWRYKYSGGIHTGLDIVSSSSDLIKAPADGTLFKSSESCGSSTINIVYIDHGNNLISLYLHVQ